MSTYGNTARLAKEVADLAAENERLRAALREIAGRDWRGNRCNDALIAEKALREAPSD